MQYTFWQTVVIGGLLKNKKLSSILLENSLTLIGEKPKDMIIDEEEFSNLIVKSDAFKNHIKKLIEKYENNFKSIDINENNKREDTLITFDEGDLLYALHDATMYVNININGNNSFNINGEIVDTYDFTDFKKLSEYVDNKDAILTDIFSTLLNNFGVVSFEYGVIKKFDVKIKFSDNNFKIEESK